MKKALIILFISTLFFKAYTQTLNWAWVMDHPATATNFSVKTLKTTSTGDIVAVGTFRGQNDFNLGPGVSNLSASGSAYDIFLVKYSPNGAIAPTGPPLPTSPTWLFKIGNSNTERVESMVIDKDDNIIICGYINGRVDLNLGFSFNYGGKIGYSTFIAKYSPSGILLWHVSYPPTIRVSNMSSDNNGRVIIAGTFTGSQDFNPSIFIITNLTTGGTSQKDIFVASLNANGTLNWAKSFHKSTNLSNTDEKVTDVCVDGTGNIYLTGAFNGTVDFNPSSGSVNYLYAFNTADVFFVKLKSNGDYVWAKAIAGLKNVESSGIVVDGSGSVYLSGRFNSTVDFDPSSASYNLISNSTITHDVFLAKYSSYGNLSWVKKFGNTYDEVVCAPKFTKNGNILLYGEFKGTVDFNPGSGINNLTTTGNSKDLFVANFKTNGDFQFANRIGNAKDEYVYDIAINKTTNQYYIAGKFTQTVDFDPSPSTFNLSSANPLYYNSFIAKYTLPGSSIIEENGGDESAKKEVEETAPIINDDVKVKELKLAPNPTNNYLNLQYIGFDNTSSTLRIYDITGKEVSNGIYSLLNTSNTGSQIDVSSLNSGLYIIIIETENAIIQEKFIKQ